VQFISTVSFKFTRLISDVYYPDIEFAYPCNDRYWLCNSNSIFLVDSNFKLIRKARNDGFWIVKNDFLWFFNHNDLLECYDYNGNRLSHDKTMSVLREMNKSVYSDVKYNVAIREALKCLIESGRFLIIEGELVPYNYKQAKQYFSLFEGSKWRSESNDLRKQFPLEISKGIIYGISVEGDKTSFWALTDKNQRKALLGIFSQYGDLLAFFSDDDINPYLINDNLIKERKQRKFNEFIPPLYRIDPKGDILLIQGYPSGIKIYKVKRTW
jgi:hypothetical protein